MGWASGSDLARNVLDAFYDIVDRVDPDGEGIINLEDEENFVFALFEAFENEDCDTLGELYGYSIAVDNVLDEKFGSED